MFLRKNYILKNKPIYNGNFKKDKEKLIELIHEKLKGNLNNVDKIANLNKKVFSHIKKTKKQLSTIFKNPLGELIGNGKDNLVFDYNGNWVIKIFNKQTYEDNSNLYHYIINKYKVLKKFLGEHIPNSYFFEGETVNPKPPFYSNLKNYQVIYPTIYTVQRKIHGYTLKDLPTNVKKTKEFTKKLKKLHLNYMSLKLYIYQLERNLFKNIGIINFKYDLGKISKKTEIDDIIMSIKTPNIMWDINKNEIFLVDFDAGFYNEKTEKIFQHLLSQNKQKILLKGEKLFNKFKKNYNSLSNSNLKSFFSQN